MNNKKEMTPSLPFQTKKFFQLVEKGALTHLQAWLKNRQADRFDCRVQDDVGRSALHVAASKNFSQLLRFLIQEEGVNVHDQDVNGNTALHIAVISNQWESVEVLLEKGSDPSLLNSFGQSPLDCVRKRLHWILEKSQGRPREVSRLVQELRRILEALQSVLESDSIVQELQNAVDKLTL